MKAATTMKAAANWAVGVAAPGKFTAPVEGIRTVPVIAIPTAPVVSTMTIVAIPASVVTAPVVAVIPRAGADKDSAYEPLRTIVAIGRAGVWIIGVIAIGACWAYVAVPGADADANSDRGLGVNCREHEDA
jgi:hypothetical protein